MRQMGSPMRQQQGQDGPRVNHKIRSSEVRLISETGEQVGVVPISEALARAEEVGLDLVEVSPEAKPPVCKLIDYGKYKYQLSKKNQEAKKKQAVVEVKEVNITPNTDTHDLETKRNHVRRWILDKNRVKVFVKFRGREMSHTEFGFKALHELLDGLSDILVQESSPRMEGKRLVVILLPRSEKEKTK